ncbi:MAG TPA: alpha/beta hydrolase [Bryobacteraceae bacterium]|nr:alpha/beta hydrolase [Bryobacteraceae bacterium]
MLYVLGFLALLIAAGILYQRFGLWRDAAKFPPPGRLVRVGPHRMHLLEMGQGSPTVVLEAGISATCVNWRRVQTEIAKFAHVVSYDRAGLGWSDRARTSRTVSQVADELQDMLRAAAVPGPYVLVGHSFGGLVVRLYAARHPDEVLGVVLVDPLRPEEWWPLTAERKRMIQGAAFLSHWGAFLGHLGVVRFTLARLAKGSRRLPRMIGKATSSGAGLATMERLVGEVKKMPQELWPAIISHWCQPKSFSGMGRHIAELPISVSSMADAVPLSGIPVTLITGAKNKPFPEDEAERMSSCARHIVAANSGHWVQLDEPEIVVEAVRELATANRALDSVEG